MTDNYHQSNEWAQQHRQSLTTRHTHEDALTDREFELLLEACNSLSEPRDLQARFVCLAAGRLGLRAGEIAHFQAEWLDWDRMLLRIPQHEPCECGYCRRQASQETTHNEQLTHEEAMEARWHPKTVASARSIPVDLSLRLELCLERFTDQYDSFPRSRTTVNRRVTAAAEAADMTVGSIRIVSVRPLPATTPTKGLRRCHSKRSWAGATLQQHRSTSAFPEEPRLTLFGKPTTDESGLISINSHRPC